MSEGVTGSDGGGGRLINVGALDIATVCGVLLVLVRKVAGCSSQLFVCSEGFGEEPLTKM